jgi:NitT/TauT family transport system permease protein
VVEADAVKLGPSRRTGGITRRRLLAFAGHAAPFVVFFGVWQLASYYWSANVATVLASPSDTVSYIAHNQSAIAGAFRVTALEALIGFACGNLAGLVAAFVLDLNQHLGRTGLAVLVIMQSIPVIAFSAILMLWFGNGLAPRATIAAYITFFPMALNVSRGLRSIDTNHRNIFNAFGASRRMVYVALRFPSILPYAFTALKASAVLAVSGAIVGELFGAQTGLGVLLLNGLYYQDQPLLWSAIYSAAGLSLAIFISASVLQQRYAWW